MAIKERTAREQETRTDESLHELHDYTWEEQGLLDAPPARPGMVQRWIATHIGGDDVPTNIRRKLNQGWKPRPADTVPDSYHVQALQHERFGNIVAIEGMILMERPAHLQERHHDSVQEQSKAQMRAVKENLFSVHRGERGAHRPTYKVSSTVSKGRLPVSDD